MFQFRSSLTFFFFVLGLHLSSYAQTITLTISSSGGETGTSGTYWSTSGTNPVTITVSGTVTLSTSVITTYLNAGTSVIVNNGATNGDITVQSAITSNGAGALTLTATRSIILKENISTVGAQTYNGALIIDDGDRTLTSSAGNIEINGNIDGDEYTYTTTTDNSIARSLSLSAVNGSNVITGNIGATTALLNLTVDSRDGTTFYGNSINLGYKIVTSTTSTTQTWEAIAAENIYDQIYFITPRAGQYKIYVRCASNNNCGTSTLRWQYTANGTTTSGQLFNNTSSWELKATVSSAFNMAFHVEQTNTVPGYNGDLKVEHTYFPSTTTEGKILITGQFIFNNSANTTINEIIAGTGSVVKSGSGTLRLSGSNTYTGGTRIDDGYLDLSYIGALGGGTTNLTFNGGGLKASWTDDYSSRFSTAAGQQYKINTNGYNVTWATALTSSGGSLTKLGTGQLGLNAANTYTGTTTISAGSLRLFRENALSNTSLTINTGVTLYLNGYNLSVGDINGSGTIDGWNNKTLTCTVNVDPQQNFSGVIQGAITLVKAGTATLNLSGTNTYTNGTSINGGYLSVTSSSNLGGGTTNLTFNGGGLKAINTTDFSNRFSTAAGQQYKLDANGQDITWATALTSNGGSLTKLGTGTLTLNAANTYTGTTTISAGTLQLNRSGGTTIPITNNVTVSGGTLKVSSNQELNNLTVNSGYLVVDAGVTLTISGTFTGGGTITNNGKIIIKGSSSFPGSSTIISAMNNLEINRSSGVTLDKDMTVTGTLILTDGVLDVSSTTLTVSGTISGASSTRYIKTSSSGGLKQSVSNSAVSFPVGNSAYNPITLTNNTGLSDNFTVRVIDEVYADGTSSGSTISTLRVKRTWDIAKATPSANAGAGVDMVFNWDPASHTSGTLAIPKLYHYESSSWVKKSITTNTTYDVVAGTLNFIGYKGDFSPFSIIDDGTALPVTWLSFTAEKQGTGALLNWSTASEQNTKDFEVQHSTNTLSWIPLGSVAAAGNSTTARQYSFTHNTPFKGGVYNYYRILQRDLDGKFSYSKIASLIYDEPGADVIVYPNPASGSVTIYLAESKEVKLINVAGATVWRGTLAAGRNNISLSHLAKGVYWVVTENYKKQLLIQ